MDLWSLLIVLGLLLLNYYLYKKEFYTKKLFAISTTFLIIYIILSIIIYYNNLAKGYEFGILYGDIFNSHFCDEYKYYMDSNILLNHLQNGEFSNWLHHSLPSYEFVDSAGHPSYGNYNIFVILLTIFRFIGISSSLNLILVKMFIYIPTLIFLYKLSRIFLSEKLSLVSVIIFSALPGFVLTNTLLMRDNIIVFLVIAVLFSIFDKKLNLKIFIPAMILLLFFRSYLVLVLIATLLITYKNAKKLISIRDILFIALVFIAIYIFTNFKFGLNHSNLFFSFYQITALQDNFYNLYGSGLIGMIKFLFTTCIQIVFIPLYLNFITSGFIYLEIFSLGNIFKIIISLVFGVRFITLVFQKPNEKILYLLKFTAYLTLLTALIVMAKDGYIITRITLMWMPLFIIIILLPWKYIKSKFQK